MERANSAAREALIVDDEPTIRELLNEILIDAGFNTTTFERGLPAIEAIKQRHFDVLIVDIGLPDISGMHICEQAREKYGEAVAILIITADNRTERLITALELGADDFIPKPFHIEELLARIQVKLHRAEEVRD